MHRDTEFKSLVRVLKQADRGLRVASVTGPGGVGKSYLLEEVFSAVDLRDLGFLHLSVDAANSQTRDDFFGLIDGQLASRSIPEPARPEYDYFPQLRSVANLHGDVVGELGKGLASQDLSPEILKGLLALLKTGRMLNGKVPKPVALLARIFTRLDPKDVDEALLVLETQLQKTAGSGAWTRLPGVLQDCLGITKRNRVRHDLYNFTADALCGDLSAALSGYRAKDWFRPTHPPIKGFTRLVIVLDDFEALAPVLSDFLVASLMPRLAKAPFPTVMFILSRDDLESLHPGFGQHAKRWLVQQLTLDSFNEETASAIMAEAGIAADRHAHLYEITRGFPFLLYLVIEQETSPDGESATFARKMFDRTTRWMTDREKEWFKALCYLDVVNEDTIEAVMAEADSASEIQHWFEREPSIREPSSRFFSIRPLIRDKCLQYFALRAPRKHKKMIERARRASEAMGEGG